MANEKDNKNQSPGITLTKEELENLITMSAMASAQALGNALKPQARSEADIKASIEAKLQCRDCGQSRAACKGKHKQVVIYPRNEEFGRFFKGIRINGILYRSANGGQPVTVPKNSDVEHMLAAWERQENILITGRKASHNSGSIGKAGSNGFIPATGGWR